MGALKEDLHKLIETTEDEALLQNIFMILSSQQPPGQIWSSLSEEQKQQVLDSEGEISDSSAWVSHEEMIKANQKWLK